MIGARHHKERDNDMLSAATHMAASLVRFSARFVGTLPNERAERQNRLYSETVDIVLGLTLLDDRLLPPLGDFARRPPMV